MDWDVMAVEYQINSKDGKVSAVHHEADSEKWMFFCHGFGSNKEGSYEKRAKRAVNEGFNAVRFDFRGNGESEGKFIEQNLSTRINDLKSVVGYFDPENYFLFGSSFGGKVIVHVSEALNPKALIMRAPVTYNSVMDDYREEVERKGQIEKIPGKKVDERFFQDFDTYSFEDVVENLNIPVIIFHGDSDQLVSIENTWRAAESMETEVSVTKFRGEGHSFSDKAEEKMRDQMFSWLKTL